MSETDTDWRDLAERLHEEGGLPERRAAAVALVDSGRTYEAAADELGLGGESPRSQIGQHVRRYRAERERAEWLVEHAPDI